jgi:hypothetical protein
VGGRRREEAGQGGRTPDLALVVRVGLVAASVAIVDAAPVAPDGVCPCTPAVASCAPARKQAPACSSRCYRESWSVLCHLT